MITRIEIDGFKSLRDVAVDLEPLTAIVGPNGSGKSNFVEALRLLSRLCADPRLDRALAANRGSIDEQFSRLPEGGKSGAIRIGVELLLDSRAGDAEAPEKPRRLVRLRYEVEILYALRGDGVEVPSIGRESLRPIAAGDDSWLRSHPDWSAVCAGPRPRTASVPDWVDSWEIRRSPDGSLSSHFPEQNVTNVSQGLRPLVPFISLPAVYFGSSTGDVVEAVAASLRQVKVLHGEPARLRASSDPKATPVLEEDGGNLPTAFQGLSADARLRVVAQLVHLVPALRRVEARHGSDDLLGLRLTLGNEEFPARLVSDGTLRLLALLVHVHASAPAGVVVVEEPENGVHPASLRALIDGLRDETRPRGSAPIPPQVILVSHSPALVAALDDQPESLVFADVAVSGADVRFTRMLHVRREGDPLDQGRTSVSPLRIRRLLDTAAPAERA